MRILFFSHYFPPEVNAPANRTHEHCREWVKAGHEVHVVTGVPSHPYGKPFPGFHRRWYQHDEIDGIHVHRVWTYLAANRGVVRRIVNYVSFIPTAAIRAWSLGAFDVAIGTSPQFFCAVATWTYTRFRRTPWVFELRDLWPESIPAVGAMKKSFVLRWLERLELRMYRDATAVVCVTESFVRNLQARGVDHGKLHFIPNGIDPAFWQSAGRQAARAELGVRDDEILACYVGTIGMAHGLGTVLEAAASLRRTAPEVIVLIVGDGAEAESLRETATRQGLSNVRFTGQIARDRVPRVLAAADMALVTLKPSNVFKTVIPSKMFEAMGARRPILLGVEGEAKALLERAGAGIAFQPGNAEALASAMERLSRDPALRTGMGEAGGEFVEREFSRQFWAGRYAALLSCLLPAAVGNRTASSPAFEEKSR